MLSDHEFLAKANNSTDICRRIRHDGGLIEVSQSSEEEVHGLLAEGTKAPPPNA